MQALTLHHQVPTRYRPLAGLAGLSGLTSLRSLTLAMHKMPAAVELASLAALSGLSDLRIAPWQAYGASPSSVDPGLQARQPR
jgi:hypothetical protein